ncbi:serine protease inhibitor Kazal-type 4 [Ochotona princeps]|uniref:serine protease inhibitor Kazal-type 4 n=1 Tax=Ochotona princeps TaxID=9978 RepID=UPI00032B085E|nr:serine protease inhibitor Kazal-type 4 [Ochotona princeps]
MAIHLGLVTLALATLLAVDGAVLMSARKLVFPRMPICEHMVEPPECPRTARLICGTDGVTYNNECHLCLTRIITKRDIQIVKDGIC